MKKLYALAVLLLGMTSCSEETITYINPVPGDEPQVGTVVLGISSENTWFTAQDEQNASVAFKSLGGEVVVDINTNVGWKFSAVNGDWLTIEKDDVADQLVMRCEGNKVEEQQQATVTVTAGTKTATIAVTQNPYGTLEIQATKNNFRIPAVGELIAEFDVQSTDEDWFYQTSGCEWLLLERSGNKITLSADPNVEIEDREMTIELIAGKGGGNPVTEKIRVVQDRAAFVSVSLKTIPFSPTPLDTDRKELTVESNFEWDFTLSENSDWLTVEKTEQGLSLTAETNPGENSRTTTITITAGDGKENMTEQLITVSQTGLDLDAFIIGIEISAGKLTSYMPFDKAVNATIDWGDGTIEENVTSEYPSHTYTDPGYYIVSVKGSVPSLNSDDIPIYGLSKQFIEVYNWGRTGLTSMENAFYNCDNLKTIATDNTEAFAAVTSFNNAFNECEMIEAIPEGFFRYATKLTEAEYTFSGCESIRSIPADLFYNTPELKSVRTCFSWTAIESIDEDLFSRNPLLENVSITFANTMISSVPENLFSRNPNIEDFDSVFTGCPKLETVPAKLFANNPEVTSFRNAFGSSGLKVIPDGLFANNTKCEEFNMTFTKCPIESIPADLFAGCSRVTTFMTCFTGCTQLKSIPADLFSNSGAGGNKMNKNAFNNIFKGCSSLTEVPAGLFDDFVTVTSFSSAFADCTSLTTLPEGLFAKNTKVTSFANAFQNCTSLKSIPDGLFSGLTLVKSFSNLFSGCTGIEEIGAGIISGCTACTNIASMFKNCTSLKTISADAFTGAPNITSITSLFEGCTQLESVPEALFAPMPKISSATSAFSKSGIKTVPAGLFSHNPMITTVGKMFMDCAALTSLPDGLFSAQHSVTTYTSAMQNCTALESVGLLFGNNTKSAKCDLLFAGSAIKTVPAGLFDPLTGATTFANAFQGCAELETLPDGLFAKNVNVTTVSMCFQNCTKLRAVPARMFEANTKTRTLTQLFEGCTGIVSIAPDAFSGLEGTSLNFMKAFTGCTSLEEVPSGLLKGQKISSYSSLFEGCTGLKRVGSEVFNCSSATAVASVFKGCSSLEEVGEKMLIQPVKLTSATSLFNGCSSLRSIPAGIFDEAVKLKYMTSTFQDCSSLEGESPYTVISGVKYHLYDRTAENADKTGFTAITSAQKCFTGCTKLSDYEQIPQLWKEE